MVNPMLAWARTRPYLEKINNRKRQSPNMTFKYHNEGNPILSRVGLKERREKEGTPDPEGNPQSMFQAPVCVPTYVATTLTLPWLRLVPSAFL